MRSSALVPALLVILLAGCSAVKEQPQVAPVAPSATVRQAAAPTPVEPVPAPPSAVSPTPAPVSLGAERAEAPYLRPIRPVADPKSHPLWCVCQWGARFVKFMVDKQPGAASPPTGDVPPASSLNS